MFLFPPPPTHTHTLSGFYAENINHLLKLKAIIVLSILIDFLRLCHHTTKVALFGPGMQSKRENVFCFSLEVVKFNILNF